MHQEKHQEVLERKAAHRHSSEGVADMGFARCGSKCTCCAKGFSPHRELATHTCKMRTANWARCAFCTADVEEHVRCVEPHGERGVHPSPICRRQLAQARPCFVSERLLVRVKICLFIERPFTSVQGWQPSSKQPCNDRYSAAQKKTSHFL